MLVIRIFVWSLLITMTTDITASKAVIKQAEEQPAAESSPKTNGAKPQDTRERLLEAAGEVFGEVGFQAATVRDICERASANIAAINYHFRDKTGLYLEVIKRAQLTVPQVTVGPNLNAPVEEKLYWFVLSMLQRMLAGDRNSLYGRILAHEMILPTEALDKVIEEALKPQIAALKGIVREFLKDDASDQTVDFCVTTVMGQCMVHRHCRSVIDRIYPTWDYSQEFMEKLARHISQVSMGGLKAFKKT